MVLDMQKLMKGASVLGMSRASKRRMSVADARPVLEVSREPLLLMRVPVCFSHREQMSRRWMGQHADGQQFLIVCHLQLRSPGQKQGGFLLPA